MSLISKKKIVLNNLVITTDPLTSRGIEAFRDMSHEMASLGSYFGSPSALPRKGGLQTLEWSSRSPAADLEMPLSDTSPSPLSPPCKGSSEWAQACSCRRFSCKGKVKTDVLSLFKTLTHENLPNLRHFAFPLATPSAWNHKRVEGILGGILGSAPGVRDSLATCSALGKLDPWGTR